MARCVRSLCYGFAGLFGSDLLEQAVGMTPAIHEVEHETNVDRDGASQHLVEHDVGSQAVPVAVEGQADEAALTVEEGRTTVSTRDVVVGEQAELHLARRLVGIRAVVGGAHQLVHDRLGLIVDHALVAGLHLLHDAF